MMVSRTWSLFWNIGKLLFISSFMAIMVLINYMMNEKALQLVPFEISNILTDRLVGPFFRQLGVGRATLSQLWAFLIAIVSFLGIAVLFHQAASLWELSRQAREASLVALLPGLRAQRVSCLLRIALALILVLGVLFMDGTLFFLRVSTLIYGYEETPEVPTVWTLIDASRDSFASQLLIALVVGYLSMTALLALLLEWAWVDFRASLDYWWQGLSEAGQRDTQRAAPSQAAQTTQAASNNGHGEESPFDLDTPVHVNGSPSGERVTRRQAMADPASYTICPCGEVFRRDHYKIYGHPGCPVHAGTR